MKMIRCATCDALLVEGATFCGQCGTVIGSVFEPTVRSSKPSLPDIQRDATINTSAPIAPLHYSTLPAPQAQFRAPQPFQDSMPVTPPPLQPLSEQDIATIRRDDGRTYDVSAAYYDEMRGRIAQHPTGPLAPPQEHKDEKKREEHYYPAGAGLLGSGMQVPSQTVPANPGVPQFGSAPSAQGVPQIAHSMRNMPQQPQFSQHQNMPLHHVQANRATLPAHAFVPNRINRPATAVRRAARVNPVAIGAVIAAAVVAVIIGVGALIITHASSNTPAPKATSTAVPTRTPIIFHPTMKVGGSMLPGSTITLHGADFPPGGHVVFKLDGAPLNTAMVVGAPLASYGPVAPVAQAEMRQEATTGTVVKLDGTFDTQITIPTLWQGGSQHQIQAAVQGAQGEVHVDLTVQVQKPGVTPTPVTTTCIAVSSSQLSFTGVKGKSDPAAQQIKISNCGDTGTWAAQVGMDEGGDWLSLDTRGSTLASGKNATLTVTASNLHAGLAAGIYKGHITFTMGSSAETVDISLSVSSNPCIATDTSALSFAGVAGISDPTTQSVTISDCGDNEGWSSTISTSDSNNWLGTDSSNGTLSSGATRTLTVTASNLNAQLSAGTYHGTITFTAGQQSAKVAVTLVVSQAPCIKVDQTSLAFSGVAGTSDPTASQVTLSNCGANGNWSSAVAYDDTSSGWLSSDTGASLNSGATQAVKVTASNLTAQLAAGTYQGHITYTITTSTGTKAVTVGVTLTVYAKACITASPTTFTMSGVVNSSDPAAQTETLTNCGEDGTWTATVSSAAASWLSLGTTSGSLSAGGTQTLTVTASNLTGKLSAGTYTGTLTYTITTAHGGTTTATATVTLTVYNPPCLQFTQINGQTASNATTDSISFSAFVGQSNPASQMVTLNNCGSDSGTWSANVTSGSSWLSTGSTGSTLSANTSQDVTIAAANQSAGTYTGQIVFTLTTPGGTASVTLNVTFTVLQGSCVQVTTPSSGSLSFSGTARTGATNSQTVTIANCGADGTWSVAKTTTDGASWLSALTSNEATSGSLTAGSSVDLAAWADSTSLTAGTYTGTLTFTMTASNGAASSTAQVSVTFTVQAAACINVSAINGQAPSGSTPYTLTFNGTYSTKSPDAQSVTLSNCGGDGTVSASITYTSSNASGWLSTDLTNNTSMSAGSTLNVNVNATTGSLTVDQYTATIRFTITTSNGTTYYQDVNVVFIITISLS